VGKVASALDLDPDIAVTTLAPSDIADTNAVRDPNPPCENPCIWIIMQQLSQPIGR